MNRRTLISILMLVPVLALSQQRAIDTMLSDPSLKSGSAALLIVDINNGEIIADRNSSLSLTPASVMKLITSAAALELLGPDHRFETTIGYTGTVKKGSGILRGDIIIMGGGDPVLGSENFAEYYGNFPDEWILEIASAGIKKIKGRVIADDSYFDYQPVPPGWNWEDIGNYYGAGVYGISLYDNTLKIHFRTSGPGTAPEMLYTEPGDPGIFFRSYVKVSGNSDQGYVYMAPYSSSGWISGTIPANSDNFILKASLPDPPLLLSRILTGRLKAAGITVSQEPGTVRLSYSYNLECYTEITTITSPPLSEIIKILNTESVNLYAEHLVKEIGKETSGEGSTDAGLKAIRQFLESIGLDTGGLFIGDGSGLSPQDALNPGQVVKLLMYMKGKSKNWDEYFGSLPEAGKEGTLKDCFMDPVFSGRLRAKSGTLTRSKAYSGYFETMTGREMAFCYIVNNFTGPSAEIVRHIEEILKETILNK